MKLCSNQELATMRRTQKVSFQFPCSMILLETATALCPLEQLAHWVALSMYTVHVCTFAAL